MIDLFSDTLTRPTPEMRRFMCEAEVGDEQKGEDPTVNRLQEMVAELLGKEAAVYLPSGTMCNEIALKVHTRPGDEVLADRTSHLIHFEGGGPGLLSGVIMTALDGEQALERVRESRPDLIVLDIMMPKMDGYETCRVLKADETTRDIPVILLSAKGRNVDQQMGFEVGAEDYITKPFSPRKLVDRINAILNQSREQKLAS